MSKTALVVDDSRVARHVLAKLLAENGIAAESAESAEAALEYLKHRRPDVIFMDHLMPGMDGFQALEAIKANPATATIPVMMYTSQQGELYVGQARALGAFGVLPKDMKPVEVNRVLKALRLIPGDRAEDRDSSGRRADAMDARRMTELLEELFKHQRSVLREDIRESYERALSATQPLQTITVPQAEPKRRSSRSAVVAAILLGALAMTLGGLYWNTTRLLQDTMRRSSDLLASTAQLTDASVQAVDGRTRNAPSGVGFGELIEWALNENATYGFDEIALSEPRAEKLRRAIQYASAAGLSGRFLLRVHVGSFCMSYGVTGTPEMAAASLPVTQCEQVGWLPSEAFALGRRQTLGFANIVMAAQSGTRIRVETASAGADMPSVPYPALRETVSAGEWNRVAALNHRIEIRWVPEAQAAAAR